MARKIIGKIYVRGAMVAQTPLSVGGAGAGDAVDLEIAQDGAGDFYVPGTSLMGPLRRCLRSGLANNAGLADKLLGFQKKDEGHASWLSIADAPLTVPDGIFREIRTGIQIRRDTGTARDKFMYTRAILPRGTRFNLALELDLAQGDAQAEAMLGALLKILAQEGLRLGSAKTRGLGQVAPEGDWQINKFDFTKGAQVVQDWLRYLGGDPAKGKANIEHLRTDPTVNLEGRDYLDITIQWTPLSPVMTKAAIDGGASDMLPLVSGTRSGKVAPVLGGGGIKGVLRSHAARILRTVQGNKHDHWKVDEDNADPDPNLSLIADLFGCRENAGRLQVDDVYQVENDIDAASWLAEDPATLNQATVHEDHVAIDRFTGGASDSALYSTRVPRRDKKWDAIRLRIDFSRPYYQRSPKASVTLSREMQLAETALVLLALRDIAAGFLPLGFATRRGMGEITITGIAITGRIGGGPVDIKDFKPDLSGLTALGGIQEAWTSFQSKDGALLDGAAQATPQEIAQ